jgi:hypothetical protein
MFTPTPPTLHPLHPKQLRLPRLILLAPPALPSAQSGPRAALKPISAPTPNATHQHPATEKSATSDNKPWKLQRTPKYLSHRSCTLLFSFFSTDKKTTTCSDHALTPLNSSNSTHRNNKHKHPDPKTNQKVHGETLLRYYPATYRLKPINNLFSKLSGAPPKVSAALHASPLLLKSLLKDGFSPIPLDKIEEKYHITFSRNTRKHDINSKRTATGSRPAGCGCCELGSYAMLS